MALLGIYVKFQAISSISQGQNFWMRRKGFQEGQVPPEKLSSTEIVSWTLGMWSRFRLSDTIRLCHSPFF